MRNWLFIVCMFPLAVFGQDSISHWRLGGALQSGTFGRWTQLKSGPPEIKERLDEAERNGSAWGARFITQYQLKSSSRLEASLGVSQGFYRVDTIAEAEMYDVRYRYTFIDIPIGIAGTWANLGKWSIEGNIGIVGSVLMSQRTSYLFIGLADGDVWEEPNLRRFLPGVYGEVAFRKEIYSGSYLSFGARIHQMILPTVNGPLQRYLYQGTVNIAYVRAFGK